MGTSQLHFGRPLAGHPRHCAENPQHDFPDDRRSGDAGARAPRPDSHLISRIIWSPSARSALPSATIPAGRGSDPWQQRVPTPEFFLRRPIVERDRTFAEVPDFKHDGRRGNFRSGNIAAYGRLLHTDQRGEPRL